MEIVSTGHSGIVVNSTDREELDVLILCATGTSVSARASERHPGKNSLGVDIIALSERDARTQTARRVAGLLALKGA